MCSASKSLLITLIQLLSCIYVGSCHRSKARPQVADGGDGLQIWRAAANVLNKQTQIVHKEWSSSLGVSKWRALVNTVMSFRVL